MTMKALAAKLYDLRRRLWGRYVLDDPRPMARAAPYTFYLPPAVQTGALQPGDLVKLVFRSIPPGREWEAERIWVMITGRDAGGFTGTLDNIPSDMPQLKRGAEVSFQAHHIISIDWRDEAKAAAFVEPEVQVWIRCWVDACVVDDGVPIGYLYREEPEAAREGDQYPDSGWRIRGAVGDQTQAAVSERQARFIAMGVVLNIDDSWLHLIDEPVGSAFYRDAASGLFVADTDGPT